MSNNPLKRGPYKKYLVDEEEPIPKRSSIFYSNTSETVNDPAPVVEVNNTSSESDAESEINIMPDQYQNLTSNEDVDNSEDTADQQPEPTLYRNDSTAFAGHLEEQSSSDDTADKQPEPNYESSRDQSSRSCNHLSIPPTRLRVSDSPAHQAFHTPINTIEEEGEEDTLDSDMEVDDQSDELTHDVYDAGENESEGEGEPESEEEIPAGHEEDRSEAYEDTDEADEERAASSSEDEGNHQQPDENLEVLAGHENLRSAIQNDPTFTSPITAEVTCSPAETLLKLLALREQNNLSFKAFVDTAKLVNSMFASPVVQGTQYLLDKLLMSSTGVSRYFYCKKCSFSFGKVDHKAVPELLCPNCSTNNPLQDLTQATYFVLFPIECQLELLFMEKEVRESLVDPKVAVSQNNDKNILKDVYDGTCYREFAASLPDNLGEKVISCVFCTDGSPLFKSSSYSIWPFFLCINELPPLIRMKNLLLGGLWFGSKHPPMDLFLKPVVDHLSLLSDPGFKIKVDGDVWKMRLYTIAGCVDSGARGSVQGINSHSGYFSCNWCLIPGGWLDKMIFPFEEVASPPRTHESVIEHGRECLSDNSLLYVYGVQYVSPLILLPKFDIVRGMVQDFPHNVPFGIARTFLTEWLDNSKRSFYVGSPNDLSTLNRRMACITPCIEVRRALRPLKDIANWKAREFENWILFFSLLILAGVLPPTFWTHWSYLVQAVYLLSRQSVSTEQVNNAHKLIRLWVADVSRLYGEQYMSFNVHIFSHLAENVARWGPTWAVSTYCFESFIGILKKILHAQRGVAHQIERELSYCQAKRILLNACSTARTDVFLDSIKSKPNKMTVYLPLEECAVIGKGEDFVPDEEQRFLMSTYDIDIENCAAYSKIISSRCVYTTDRLCAGKKFNNSVALTTSGSIIIIKKFIRDKESDKVYVFYVEADCRVFLRFPPGIRICDKDHCLRIIHSIGHRLKLSSVKDLEIVCVVSKMEGKMYVTPFHNLFNVC